MQIEYFFCKSPIKAESEDAYVINDSRKVYGVFDGATPITSFHDKDGHNGAYLAAHLFQDYFENLEELPLVQAVVQANDLLRRKMENNQIDISIKHHLWSTCVALVQVKNNLVEYAQLGDSMIVAGFKDGTINVVTEDTVKGISQRAKEKRIRDRQNGLAVPDEDSFKNVQNALIYNRTMANTPEGYSVANGMPEVKEYIQSGIIELKNLAYLLIITDGMFYPGKSLEFTLDRVLEMGLKLYSDELARIRLDKNIIDDMTAILLKF